MKSVTENQGKFPPMPEAAWRFNMLLLYMQRYARDPLFHKRFEDFYRRHQEFVNETMKDTCGDYLGDEPTRAEKSFFRERAAFMETTGLAALPDDFALQQVDHWLNLRARTGNLDWKSELLGSEIVLPRDLGLRNPGVERDEWLIPVIRVPFEGRRWPGDSATDAITHLTREFEAEVRREVERIDAAYKAVGYIERDTLHALERHLDWLYRRVASRDSCEDIAADERRAGRKIGGDGIQKATKQIAVTIGVAIPRSRRRTRR